MPKTILIAALLALPARLDAAVQIESVLWGFDGRAVPNRFNPLSVQISNPGDEPFEATLRLRKSMPSGQRLGAILEERVFVSPYATRWVQFYPYVINRHDEWTLTWEGERYAVPSPKLGPPAGVLLGSPESLRQGIPGVRRFPEPLFPPLVTATDGLQVLFLDAAPRWEEARRQAFLDWLSRGGRVHVLQRPDGAFPQFPEELGVLNTPLERRRVGSGIVVKHRRSRDDLTPEFVNATLAETGGDDAARGGAKDDEASGEDAGETSAQASRRRTPRYDQWSTDTGFFTNLKRMMQVSHNWLLIHLLSVIYLLVIFPGCFVLARAFRDYRLSYLALLGTVGLFSLGFHVVGRRGYGESTTVHSVAVARQLRGGLYDVTQWSNVFVTDGDDYTITHGGLGRLYSTCQETEAVNGLIRNGRRGRFVVDIPPFSSRSFVHRTRLKGPRIEVLLRARQGEERLEELTLQAGGNFPEETERILALYRDRVYRMTRRGDQLELTHNIGTVPAYLRDGFAGFGRFAGPWGGDGEKTPRKRFREMVPHLVGRSLNLHATEEIDDFRLPDDRVRLFVYAPMPEAFSVRNERLGKQTGYVLYSIDVFLTGGS